MSDHVHSFSPGAHAAVDLGTKTKKSNKDRPGYVCECGLVALPPKKCTPGSSDLALWERDQRTGHMPRHPNLKIGS